MAPSASLRRGQIWWARLPPPDKTRPVVLVSRGDAYKVRELFIVAPVTRLIRGIAAEVSVGEFEGLPAKSVVNCDSLRTARRSMLAERIGEASGPKLAELDRALKFALGLD